MTRIHKWIIVDHRYGLFIVDRDRLQKRGAIHTRDIDNAKLFDSMDEALSHIDTDLPEGEYGISEYIFKR